ncbi:MAG: hypothetical protein HQK81_10910 [Desulfovibrionaceae bacterium]|nr:hypothetical protein [Desulfovibrionaceae bacterium]MBF0514551.1 hypothetical protein [Desulfovibrionaceae bacterium]
MAWYIKKTPMPTRERLYLAGIFLAMAALLTGAILIFTTSLAASEAAQRVIEGQTRLVAATEERARTGRELERLLTPPVDPQPEKVFGRK